MYKITEKVALNPTVTKMVIEAPLIAKKAKPGQFIIVRPFEDSERIPLTVAGYDREAGTVEIIFQIVVGTMTGAQSRKIHTEPEWAWSLADQAHKLGIPVFMKEDLVPIIGDENMIQEMPEEFNKVLEVQKLWKK